MLWAEGIVCASGTPVRKAKFAQILYRAAVFFADFDYKDTKPWTWYDTAVEMQGSSDDAVVPQEVS